MENESTPGSGIGLFILRLFAGVRILYGVLDNVVSAEDMEEFASFLNHFNFPYPHISASVSVYVQLICGILILIGYKIRWASVLLAINFLVAIFMVHIPNGDSIEVTTPALALFTISLCLIFTGSGRYSVDELLKLKSSS